ncbi:hypothetical protein BJ684DRAFT_20163 [Piptocephalis cylindrospora]|uniref:Protein kinase domain-containing protein n=1 Tax=Piptocephalis cylindrospora TaxID=1907219 RepID=A0A4P9Y3E8_9FUNG|nr:hypothetical protein BJ684DRAFT_20163 [Piptocephalis cylindrospora]|eukprot:RKP13333.1 hypothetical protein BJ684DRAFT_20163 [Piptocephalis cylindrospora]
MASKLVYLSSSEASGPSILHQLFQNAVVEARPSGHVGRISEVLQKAFYLRQVQCSELTSNYALNSNERLPPLFPSVDEAFKKWPIVGYPAWGKFALRAFLQAINLEKAKHDKKSRAHGKTDDDPDTILAFFQTSTGRQAPMTIDPSNSMHDNVIKGRWFFSALTSQSTKVSLHFIRKTGIIGQDRTIRDIKKTIEAFVASPNSVLQLLDVYVTHPTHWILVTPRVSFPLSRLLKEPKLIKLWGSSLQPENPIPEWVIRDIFIAVIHAAQELHSMRIVHRNLQPESIFCLKTPTTPCNPKFSRFSFAKGSEDSMQEALGVSNRRYLPLGAKDEAVSKLKERHYQRADIRFIVLSIYDLFDTPNPKRPGKDRASYFDRKWDIKNSLDRPVSPTIHSLLEKVLPQERWIEDPMSMDDLVAVANQWKKEPLGH